MAVLGRDTGTIHDEDRPAWRGPGPRPIRWSAWYPTDDPVSAVATGPRDLFRSAPGAWGGEVSGTQHRWPVVLLSHGTGGEARGLDWLGSSRLAASGYICLGVSHHGNCAGEPYLAEGSACWWERARDLTVLLDHLSKAPRWRGQLDLEQVFAAGFSLGGYTVLALAGTRTSMARFLKWLEATPKMGAGPREFPDLGDQIARLHETSPVFRASWERASADYTDPRVRAVAAFAPAPPVRGFEPASVGALTLPVGIMVGGADREAPADLCSEWLVRQNPNFRLALLGKSVGHYVFLNEATEYGRLEAPEICVDAPDVNRADIHDRAAGFAEEIFRAAVHTPAQTS